MEPGALIFIWMVRVEKRRTCRAAPAAYQKAPLTPYWWEIVVVVVWSRKIEVGVVEWRRKMVVVVVYHHCLKMLLRCTTGGHGKRTSSSQEAPILCQK